MLLGIDSLTIEAEWTQYSDYAAWRARFERVWQAAIVHLGPPAVGYQGLRYIDHLDAVSSARKSRNRSPPAWRLLTQSPSSIASQLRLSEAGAWEQAPRVAVRSSSEPDNSPPITVSDDDDE